MRQTIRKKVEISLLHYENQLLAWEENLLASNSQFDIKVLAPQIEILVDSTKPLLARIAVDGKELDSQSLHLIPLN